MSIRKGNDIIASKPLVDAVPTQDSTNAVSSGGVYDALATKQDIISDLATIRSGAAAGATAVQPSDLATVATTGNYNDLLNKPTIPTTLAALTGDVSITSPTNNQHLVYDGNDQKWKNTTSLALENTATATDALTILGVSNTSWTNGINIGKDSRINSNNGVAIGVDASADVNAVGIGRDTDAGVRGTAIGAYAKTSADTGIAIGCWNSTMNNAVSSAKGAYQFGVGTNNTARTMNVGWYDDSVTPSTFRNYQLLDGNTGLIPDARISTNIARTTDLNNKVDVGHQVIDFQEPTALNNYTWYRKYADGWVEQGGIATIPARTNTGGSDLVKTFLVEMADTNYTALISFQNGGNRFAECQLTFSNRQTTGVNLTYFFNGSGTTAAFLVGWEVKGMAA